jgi:hypothetical protein
LKKSSFAVSLVVAVLIGALAGYGLSSAMGATRTSTTPSTTSIFVTTSTINQNEIVTFTTATRTILSVSTATEFLPTTATETLFLPTSNQTAVPSLQLSASVTPSNGSSGQNFSIRADVYNSLPNIVTLNTTEITNHANGPCGSGAIAVTAYSGHYTFSNVSNATPLILFNASLAISCFATFRGSYTFSPNSDNATIHYVFPASLNFSKSVNLNENLSGYWIREGNGTLFNFQSFLPGTYSAVVSDAWGQELMCYFRVT